MIISHNHIRYQRRQEHSGDNRWNGAYYYSREIVKNIIPRVETDRHWVTVNIPGECRSHCLLFIHNNLRLEQYDWIYEYGFQDVVLICGTEATWKHFHEEGKTAIHLPLSIDTEYIKQFKSSEKTKKVAFAGRKAKTILGHFPDGIDYLSGMKREDLLQKMAQYEQIYAVGRTAIEAKALGCEVLPYDSRYPDPGIWKVLDNKDAAELLQEQLHELGL